MILLTGHSNVPTALRAMKEGAWDYVEKPCSTERPTDVLRRALSHRAVVLQARRSERIEERLFAGGVIEIPVPSLKDRQQDLPLIFESLLRQAVRNLDGDMPEIPASMQSELISREWAGNLPELRNVAVSFALGRRGRSMDTPFTLAEQLDAFEQTVLIQTLQRTKGRVSDGGKASGRAAQHVP